QIVIHKTRYPAYVLFHWSPTGSTRLRSCFQRLRNLVDTCRDRRGSQRTQSQQQAYKGNTQEFKNTIHAEGYQGVAERREKISNYRYLRLLRAGLGGGVDDQGVEALGEPAEIEPRQGGSGCDARGPVAMVIQ